LCAFFAMAGTVNVEAAELCHCNHDRQSDMGSPLSNTAITIPITHIQMAISSAP
jgi:hypothetical protein